MKALVAVAVLALAPAGCRTQDDTGSSPARSEPAMGMPVNSGSAAGPTPGHEPGQGRGHVQFVPAPAEGDVAALVRAEAARAAPQARTLLVYVGASWCEPCQRFHHAAEAGQLDASLATLTLLEFDADRDAERLLGAGYGSKLIPLFAVPQADGRASTLRIEGAIKGEGAVGFIEPRLKALLAQAGK